MRCARGGAIEEEADICARSEMKLRNYALWKRLRVAEGELDQQSGPRKGRKGGRGDKKSSRYARAQQGVRRVKPKQARRPLPQMVENTELDHRLCGKGRQDTRESQRCGVWRLRREEQVRVDGTKDGNMVRRLVGYGGGIKACPGGVEGGSGTGR